MTATDPAPSIRSVIPEPGRFSEFNREERNAVAMLFAALLKPECLLAFAQAVNWSPPDIESAEVFVEWTYLRDLWFAARRADVDLKAAVLATLQPSARSKLAGSSTLEFNEHFGCVPRPSAHYIQSPGNWSIVRCSPNISDHEEFRRTCVYKWAFNVKPDLVVQTERGHVLCIEAKWESNEGVYPTAAIEKKIFADRKLEPVNQRVVQRYLVERLLDFDGAFRYLVRKKPKGTDAEVTTWASVLGALDLSHLPSYMQQWAQKELGAP